MMLTLKEILGACKRKPEVIISVIISFAFGLGCLCGDTKPKEINFSNVRIPTESNSSSNEPPKPTSPPAPFNSGGLGLNKSDWEKIFGTGKPDNSSEPSFYAYDSNNLSVQFDGGKAGNVKYIERIWGDTRAIPIAEARKESKKYIPKDAKFVKTYTSSSSSTIDLYQSQSLITRFESGEFIGGKPGDFIILYRNQTGKVTTFIVALGNNP